MKKFIKMFKNLDFEAIIYIMCVLGVFISFFLYSLFFILIINKKFKKKATCSEVITEQFCSTLGSLAKVALAEC